jgi:hypothetical protein
MVIEQFHLRVQENRFIAEIPPATPSNLLVAILEQELPWAIAVGSEIARYIASANKVKA